MRSVSKIRLPFKLKPCRFCSAAPQILSASLRQAPEKPSAFGIPLVNLVEPGIMGVQGLILCPTRELALQVTEHINLLGRAIDVRAVAIYGGSSYSDQIHGLKTGATIVVGTPGRLVDHIKRGTLNLKGVRTVVLDEADEMISMGFKEDLETILAASSPGVGHTWLFSATMDPEVRKVADKFLKGPRFVQVNRTEVLSNTVRASFLRHSRIQQSPTFSAN